MHNTIIEERIRATAAPLCSGRSFGRSLLFGPVRAVFPVGGGGGRRRKREVGHRCWTGGGGSCEEQGVGGGEPVTLSAATGRKAAMVG